jgi:group I intron endonuclease
VAEEMIGVYAIVNTANHKAYVGSSKNVKKRFLCHASFLRRGKHHCAHLQSSFSLRGENEFQFRVLVECATREEAQEIEQALLDIWHDDLYNASKRADHLHRLGRPLDETTKQKISVKNSGAFRSPEQRKLISESLKKRYQEGMQSPQLGRTHSDEAKAKIKARRALQTPANLGNVATQETRLKQSLAKKGNRCHAKTVCTDSACFFGLDIAAQHYQVSTPTFRRMMQRNGWSFYENL